MQLRRIAKSAARLRITSLLLASAVVLSSLPAAADTVVQKNETTFGKVTKITQDTVIVARGCKADASVSLPKAEVRYILLDARCTPGPILPPTGGLQVCGEPRVDRYRIQAANPNREYVATDVLMGDDATIRLVLANGTGMLAVPTSRITSIIYGPVCPADISREEPSADSDSCLEPPQWAVEWSRAPVHNNTIFTRGFSFFMDVDRASAASTAPDATDVRLAFGTALTYWMSALARIRDSVEPELADYLRKALRCSERFCLLTPPQVIVVRCPTNALMVVRWTSARNSIFPVTEKSYLAKAQVEGRTIVINGIDHQYRTDQAMQGLIDANRRINLAVVLTHELGHAFGLPHVTARHSIMNPDDLAVEPSDADAHELAAVLKQDIVGAQPGVFNATVCAGLKLPTVE